MRSWQTHETLLHKLKEATRKAKRTKLFPQPISPPNQKITYQWGKMGTYAPRTGQHSMFFAKLDTI